MKSFKQYITEDFHTKWKHKEPKKAVEQYVKVFGTPDEVENFEAWATILKGSQVKSEEDLLKCYNYWKEYHESELQKRKSEIFARG